jgi:transcriptional regulator
MEESKVMAFFCCLPNIGREFDMVEAKLLTYKPKSYIIALEKSATAHKRFDGYHLHFIVEWTDTDYKNFSENVCRKYLGLTGRAQKMKMYDGTVKETFREYGKVKEIRDLDAMKAYTVKDKNVRTNLPAEEIERLISLSYPRKQSFKSLQEELFAELDKTGSKAEEILGIAIIKFLKENGKHASEIVVFRHLDMYLLARGYKTDREHFEQIAKRARRN